MKRKVLAFILLASIVTQNFSVSTIYAYYGADTYLENPPWRKFYFYKLFWWIWRHRSVPFNKSKRPIYRNCSGKDGFYTDKTAAKGVQYYYKAFACRYVNGEFYYSGYSDILPMTFH